MSKGRAAWKEQKKHLKSLDYKKATPEVGNKIHSMKY
jgi:hypothetical protein